MQPISMSCRVAGGVSEGRQLAGSKGMFTLTVSRRVIVRKVGKLPGIKHCLWRETKGGSGRTSCSLFIRF